MPLRMLLDVRALQLAGTYLQSRKLLDQIDGAPNAPLLSEIHRYVPGGKVKLDEVTKILGLPGKPQGIDGRRATGLR